jgi:hypothetical protein
LDAHKVTHIRHGQQASSIMVTQVSDQQSDYMHDNPVVHDHTRIAPGPHAPDTTTTRSIHGQGGDMHAQMHTNVDVHDDKHIILGQQGANISSTDFIQEPIKHVYAHTDMESKQHYNGAPVHMSSDPPRRHAPTTSIFQPLHKTSSTLGARKLRAQLSLSSRNKTNNAGVNPNPPNPTATPANHTHASNNISSSSPEIVQPPPSHILASFDHDNPSFQAETNSKTSLQRIAAMNLRRQITTAAQGGEGATSRKNDATNPQRVVLNTARQSTSAPHEDNATCAALRAAEIDAQREPAASHQKHTDTHLDRHSATAPQWDGADLYLSKRPSGENQTQNSSSTDEDVDTCVIFEQESESESELDLTHMHEDHPSDTQHVRQQRPKSSTSRAAKRADAAHARGCHSAAGSDDAHTRRLVDADRVMLSAWQLSSSRSTSRGDASTRIDSDSDSHDTYEQLSVDEVQMRSESASHEPKIREVDADGEPEDRHSSSFLSCSSSSSACTYHTSCTNTHHDQTHHGSTHANEWAVLHRDSSSGMPGHAHSGRRDVVAVLQQTLQQDHLPATLVIDDAARGGSQSLSSSFDRTSATSTDGAYDVHVSRWSHSHHLDNATTYAPDLHQGDNVAYAPDVLKSRALPEPWPVHAHTHHETVQDHWDASSSSEQTSFASMYDVNYTYESSD